MRPSGLPIYLTITSKLMPNTEASEFRGQIINPSTIDTTAIQVVAAIIWNPKNRRQFLISRRQKGKHLADFWELPGGKMEASESRLQALKRELKEEIDIVVADAAPFMQVYHQYPDRNILLDVWVVNDYAGLISAREQQQLLWIDIDQIDDYQFPAADLPVLDALKAAL